MRKGTAMEGFIREDGTIRPIEHYDDTELRGKIQTNTDNISNLDSRLTAAEDDIDYLKTHGGAEDPTKADKVEGAVEGNLAGLDGEGNLTDSGKKPADFAQADHYHGDIYYQDNDGHGHVYTTSSEDDGGEVHIIVKKGDGNYKSAIITDANINNLIRALANPDDSPTAYSTNLVTSGGVKTALDTKSSITRASIDSRVEVEVNHIGDDEYDQATVIGGNRIFLGVGEDAEDGSAIIDANNIVNLRRALEEPVSNKLDIPDDSLMVKFDVSGGALTLVSDTTEYDNIFGLVTSGNTITVTTFVGIYNSDDDVYTKFFGVVSVSDTIQEINATIYVGGYTIYLNKNVSSGTITVSMDSFAALLQNS